MPDGQTPIADLDPKWEEHIDLIRRTVAQGATPDELRHFLYIARNAGLDPLAKQIYYIRRKGKGTIQVAIDGLRLIADRTRRYAGCDSVEFMGVVDGGYPEIARATVYKMVSGVRCPFSASVRWQEYYPGDDQGLTWRNKPHTMLAKCAEAHALRRAFPADMSGMYVHEEMAQAGGPVPEPEQMPSPERMIDAPAATVGGDPEPIPSEPIAPESPGDPGPDPYQPGPAPEPTIAQATGEVALAERPKPADAPKVETAESGGLPRAFGYAPPKWPSAKMMGEAATENQFRMLRNKADQRHLNEKELALVRESVLREFGVEDDASKGAVSLLIDFLIAASPAALDAARGVRRAG